MGNTIFYHEQKQKCDAVMKKDHFCIFIFTLILKCLGLRISIYLVQLSKFDLKYVLSHDVASGSEITPCNKICKPLVVYRFSGNVMTSITTLRT